MDIPAVARRYGAIALGSFGMALWLAALYLLGTAARNSASFDRWLPWILLINITGLLTLVVLLARKLLNLVREYRAGAPGSRFKARTVVLFSALAVAPVSNPWLPAIAFCTWLCRKTSRPPLSESNTGAPS